MRMLELLAIAEKYDPSLVAKLAAALSQQKING